MYRTLMSLTLGMAISSVATPHAQAQRLVEFPAAPSGGELQWTPRGDWRGPSGFAGTDIDRSFTAEPGWALTELIFREKNDDAVYVEFVGRRLCADQSCDFQTLRTLRVSSGVDGTFYSQKWVNAGDERYATALQVCTSSSGKIKGVRMWPARIRANSTLEQGSRVEFRRPNCSDNRWHQKEECGPRQVIVGIRAVGTSQKGYTGLSIKCGRVE